MRPIARTAASLLLLAMCQASPAKDIGFPLDLSGTVVYVEDGDTLTLLDLNKRQHVIRLTDLDAPESPKEKHGKAGQPYSKASGRNLAAMTKGKSADVHCYEFDAHHRLVCRVIVNGIDVSLEQIKAGFAWANGASKRFVRDQRAYLYEAEARSSRSGLWADSHPVEPWIWRRRCWSDGLCSGAGE